MDEASFKREDYLLFLMTEYSQLKLLGTTKIRKRPRNKGHEKLPRTGPYPEDKNEKSPSPNAQKNTALFPYRREQGRICAFLS